MENDLSHLEPIIEDIEETRGKKIRRIILSVFLIFLMLSFVFVTFPIDEILISNTQSTTIKEGLVQEDITVSFEDEVYSELLTIYTNEQAHEFKVCLFGSVVGDEYYVDKLVVPETFSQTFNQVVSVPCDPFTIIALHSHPYKHCIASNQDLSNLEKAREVNPEAAIGIMCGPDTFNFYR
jgi:hypothetical protein